ncbi:unnamed protein product [Allacma fusca]|uniref:Uncharacterized protein n=1 Tax=Allacma fusca TaxID=39272 RepID=A0A8J2KN90_9HEXA|nr:unnamed protein product [Allacma fusca]
MGRGVGQCSACQPCGICGIPLKIGSIIAAIFYMLDGFATLAVILYDVTYIQNQTTPKIVDTVLIGFILFATMLWIGASILLLIGSLKKFLINGDSYGDTKHSEKSLSGFVISSWNRNQ